MESRVNLAHNRVLPQRSWAGAIPTILTHDALDILCTPSADGGTGNNNYPCRPLERFLGCSYLRRQLQRIVQSEEHVCSVVKTRPTNSKSIFRNSYLVLLNHYFVAVAFTKPTRTWSDTFQIRDHAIQG